MNTLKVLIVLIFMGFTSISQAEEVYMVRGLINIFSGGIGTITERLIEEHEVNAKELNHAFLDLETSDIIKRSKNGQVSFPIIVVGHSLGGLSAVSFANRLGENDIPVKLVIGIDPGLPKPSPFKKGALNVINYKVSGRHDYESSYSYNGASIINNEVPGVNHIEIDKHKPTQDKIIGNIIEAIEDQ